MVGSNGTGRFVAIGYRGDYRMMYSGDGINWTLTYAPDTTVNYIDITYGGGMYVAISNSGSNSYYSTDGINWNSGSLGNTMMYSVTYGNGKFVAVGMYGYTYYSTDAITWTSGTTTFGYSAATLTSVIYADGKFVAVGGDGNSSNRKGEIWYSYDGMSWNLAEGVDTDYTYSGVNLW